MSNSAIPMVNNAPKPKSFNKPEYPGLVNQEVIYAVGADGNGNFIYRKGFAGGYVIYGQYSQYYNIVDLETGENTETSSAYAA